MAVVDFSWLLLRFCVFSSRTQGKGDLSEVGLSIFRMEKTNLSTFGIHQMIYISHRQPKLNRHRTAPHHTAKSRTAPAKNRTASHRTANVRTEPQRIGPHLLRVPPHCK